MNIGIHVSFLFSSDRSKSPTADASLDNRIITNVDPQIRIPPIVGVPDFFAWRAENIDDFSPVNAFSLICFPSLWWIRNLVNDGIAATVSRNASNDDPKISNKSVMNSCDMCSWL